MEYIATTYGTLMVAAASLFATLVALRISRLARESSERIATESRETSLKIATKVLTQAMVLREEQRHPRIFVRTGDVDRQENRGQDDEKHYHFLNLENRGGSTAEIDSVVACHPETGEELGRSDYGVTPRIFPGEWTPSGVKVARANVEGLDRIKVMVAYRMVDLKDEPREHATWVSLNNRMSNPMSDRSILSRNTRDCMEREFARYLERENKKALEK